MHIDKAHCPVFLLHEKLGTGSGKNT